MTRTQLMKKYNCDIFKDTGFDDSRKYWVAVGNDDACFNYADGWTLKELYKNIKLEIDRLE